MKRISIGSWAYSIGPYANNPVPWDEVVRKLADWASTASNWAASASTPIPTTCRPRKTGPARQEQLADAGLAFSGLAANLWGENLINTDDNRTTSPSSARTSTSAWTWASRASAWTTVQPPTIFDEVDADTARERVVKTWKECAREAADKGVYVTWEFEPGFAFNKPSDILRIVDEVDDDNFGVQFDTCHGHMVAAVGARQPGKKETLPGGALELAQKLRGKINHIHLIDSDGTLHDDETSTHAPFGEGMLDFDELLPELNKAGVPHDWWTIDLCFWPDAWDVTAECKRPSTNCNAKYGS